LDYRQFLVDTWRDMSGNVALGLSTGRTIPTDAAPHGKLVVNDFYWFSYPGELDQMVAWCEKNSARDAYLTPAVYGDAPMMVKEKLGGTETGKKIPAPMKGGRPQFDRSKDNALSCQTVYMDSDSCPPEAFRLAPSRHVQTSDGHGHDYWYLAEPVPAHEAAEIAHRITTAHRSQGSDPSGWSENKVLRIPTVNTTYDELSPFTVTSEEYASPTGEVGTVYTAMDISGAYDDVEMSATPRAKAAERPPVPAPAVEGLLDFEELVSRIPAGSSNLMDLITKEPKLGPEGWRSEQRFALMLNLLRFGFTELEAISIVWRSPVARAFSSGEDPRGIDFLWWELQERVIPVLDEERGVTISAAPKRAELAGGPKLLTPEQREAFQHRSDMVTLINQWVKARIGTIYNAPLSNINAWTALSILLGESGMIPKKKGKPMPVNLYSFSLAPSSRGKDDHLDFLRSMVRAAYPGDSPDIGAEHSKSALLEQLIERDGKVSWLHGNEFHGKLKEIKAGGWTTGIVELWTDIYGGDIPSIGRVGKKDLNKPNVTGIPVFHVMGTLRGMLEILDKEMFYSGYLARQIWVIADTVTITEDSMKVEQMEGDVVTAYNAMPKYLASVFANLRGDLRQDAPLGQKWAPLLLTREASDLFEKAKWKMYQHFAEQWDMELWDTVVFRMYDIVWKVSGLSAMSDGRTVIGTADILTALGYAEVWLDDAITVSEKVSDTFFSKQCDDIMKFLMSKADGRADQGAIHRFRHHERIDITQGYLASLKAQGKIVEEQARTGAQIYYKIREENDGKQ